MSRKTILGIPIDRNILGWITYDFANSAYVTVIVTVVFSVYFKKTVVGMEETGTALWGRATSISMALVAVLAPLLGAIADYSHLKKRFMFWFCYGSVVFTALLYFVGSGDIILGMILFILANFGFNAANVFYDAFLPEITDDKTMGKVSGMGWALGYIGGLVALVLSLILVKSGKITAVFPMIALFFGLFAVVTFILLTEKKGNHTDKPVFSEAFRRIRYSLTHIGQLPQLLRFLFSYLVYNDGIVVVITFASIYGATRFGMTSEQLVVYFILAQTTSFAGALGFGYVQDRFGSKRTIVITLILWLCVVSGAYLAENVKQYYAVGLLAGIAIGSSQASSRALLALLTPRNKMTEFFGFYSLTGRFAAILGPLVYGETARVTGSQRIAILAVSIFFLIGLGLLFTVNERKGIAEARAFEKGTP